MIDTGSDRLNANRINSFWWWMWSVGLRRYWGRWLVVHVIVGACLALIIPGSLASFALTAIIPMASILVGLTFAWGANAVSLLQTTEIQRVGAEDNGSRFRIYVFTYQNAVLVVLTTTTIWALLAAGIAVNLPLVENYYARIFGRALIFTLSSLTLRECWHACVGVQQMLLSQMRQRQRDAAIAKAKEGVASDPTKATKPIPALSPRLPVAERAGKGANQEARRKRH